LIKALHAFALELPFPMAGSPSTGHQLRSWIEPPHQFHLAVCCRTISVQLNLKKDGCSIKPLAISARRFTTYFAVH